MALNPITPAAKPADRSELKVLLVDDDAFQLDLTTEILKALGIMNVTEAQSGPKGLERLAAKGAGFHLVLLDLHMPGMDGFQFMESAANAGYAGSLVIVSGQSDDVMHAASLVARLRRFTLLGSVAKPVEPAALSRLIGQMGL
jgi:CheY-like chemotaxis protein